MRDRRARDFRSGVPPRIVSLLRQALPFLADAQPADERHAAVDHEQLPMVAMDPAERRAEPRTIERAHVSARGDERSKQTEHGTRAAPEPVVDEPDGHARAGARSQEVNESPAHHVAMDDVHLDVNRLARAVDRVLPGRIVLGRVTQHA